MLFVDVLWFERAPKHSAEVLASAPKEGLKGCDESWEKIYVLDTLPSGIDYSAVNHEFKVNESMIVLNMVSLNRSTAK